MTRPRRKWHELTRRQRREVRERMRQDIEWRDELASGFGWQSDYALAEALRAALAELGEPKR